MPAFVAAYVNERLASYKTRIDAIASTEEQVNPLTETLAKYERELTELEMARMKHVQLVNEKYVAYATIHQHHCCIGIALPQH